MSQTQLAFNFDAPAKAPRKIALPKQSPLVSVEKTAAEVYWAEQAARELAEAREHWAIGMVTNLPLWAKVPETGRHISYTQMLPGVIESIESDMAAVRIYASPEYGSWMEDYPLHRMLAVEVPIVNLGRFMHSGELDRIVAEGLLVTGDADLAGRVRARFSARAA